MKKRMKKAMAGMNQTAQAAGVLSEALKVSSLSINPPAYSTELLANVPLQAQLSAELLRDAGKMTSTMEGSYSKEEINTMVHTMVMPSPALYLTLAA
jgi:hypothetical protein